MKKIYLLFVILISTASQAEIINFPDSVFKSILLNASTSSPIAKDINNANMVIDANHDNEISDTEALTVYKLNLLTLWTVSDLTGISYFTNLRRLTGSTYSTVASLDVSMLVNLTYLYFGSSSMTTLNVSNLALLEELECSNSNLSVLDVSDLQSLKLLRCASNNLAALDVSGLTNLKSLTCDNNELTSLNLSGVNLEYINCNANHLTSLDFTAMPNLKTISCQQNELVALQVSGLSQLEFLDCVFNNLVTLDLSGLTALKSLYCAANQLTALDATSLESLEEITCIYNQLTTLDFNGLAHLRKIGCNNNNLQTLYMHGTAYSGTGDDILAFGNNPNLVYICANQDVIPVVQGFVDDLGYTNCTVDSDCLLETAQFNTTKDWVLYPNPATDFLYMDSADGKISAIEVYNTLGQEVITANGASISKIDVSDFVFGNYFIRIHSDKGTTNAKFAKK